MICHFGNSDLQCSQFTVSVYTCSSDAQFLPGWHAAQGELSHCVFFIFIWGGGDNGTSDFHTQALHCCSFRQMACGNVMSFMDEKLDGTKCAIWEAQNEKTLDKKRAAENCGRERY